MTRLRRPAPNPGERKRLFRRMEWVFVWGPPLLIAVVAGTVAALVAWLLRFGGMGFWGRWAAVFALIVGVALVAHLITNRFSR